MEIKKCTKCEEEKPLDAFYLKPNGNPRTPCKACTKKHYDENKERIKLEAKNRYAENREEIIERTKAYRRDNPDKVLSSRKKYYDRNRTSILKKKQEHYIANKDKLDAWRVDNKGLIAERDKKYREDNKELVAERKRKWSQDNHERCCEYARRRQALKLGATVEKVCYAAIRERDVTCYLCFTPFTDEERRSATLTHVDHKIPLSRGGEHSYANCALTHKRCNLSKNDKTPEEYWSIP